MRRVVLRVVAASVFFTAAFEAWWLSESFTTLQSLNARFESSLNETNRPDYQVNGLLIHMNDGWADAEIHQKSRDLGFVSFSYIRRDVSKRHAPPVFYSPKFRELPWMSDTQAGTGVILDHEAMFNPLCFFVRDAASHGRNYYGCGGLVAGTWRPELPFSYPQHFLEYGFKDVPKLLDYRALEHEPLENLYVPGEGIATCSLYGISDSFDYDAKLLSDTRTTCSFAISKEVFSVALDFSRKYQRAYNEFVVQEWSEIENPVAAIIYLGSASGRGISAHDSRYFETEARRLQRHLLLSKRLFIPVYRLELDAFRDPSLKILDSAWWQNSFFSVFLSLGALLG